MPRFDEDQLPTKTFDLPGQVNVPDTAFEPDFWEDVVPAAFRMENSVVSAEHRLRGESDERRLDRRASVPEELEQFRDRYRNSNSILEDDMITRHLQNELATKETLEAAGASGIAAEMAAGLLDPINLIPVGGAAIRAARAGERILDGAIYTAKAGLIGAASAEALLQSSQETRTAKESALNITASTFLAGVLGTSSVAVRELIEASGGSMDDILRGVESDLTLGDSVGAASARGDIPLEAEGIRKDNAALNAALRAVKFQDPTLRTLEHPFRSVREQSQLLAETPLELGKNELGEATPRSVQAIVRNSQANLYRGLKGVDNAFANYTRGRDKRFGDIVLSEIQSRVPGAGGKDQLRYSDFREQVGLAMRRGDQHEIPEVAEAARIMRREVFEPLKDAAVEAGLLDADVDVNTAISYLNRVYKIEKLKQPREADKFVATTTEWLMRRRANAELREQTAKAELEDLNAQLKKAQEEKAENVADLRAEIQRRERQREKDQFDVDRDALEMEDIAQQILSRIVNTPAGRLPYDVSLPESRVGPRRGRNTPARAGPLKARLFEIEDELIESWLENDIEVLAKMFTRSVAPDVAIARNFGDLEMTEQMKAITDEKNDIARQLKDVETDTARREEIDAELVDADGETIERLNAELKNLDERAKARRPDLKKFSLDDDSLTKMEDRGMADLLAMRDRIRGVYGLPDNPMAAAPRVGRALRQLNYIRLLGGMTLSAIPDMARPVMVHGFGRVFRDVLIPAITNFKSLKLTAEQLRDLGAASDMLLNSRAQSLAHIEDDFSRHMKLERALGAAADTFGMVSLMSPWNTFWKQLSGLTSQTRFLRAIEKEVAGNINAKDARMLRAAGISTDDARMIFQQFQEHGGIEGSLYMPNTNAWTDKGAFEAIQTAILRDVERTIVTPGLDLPNLSVSTEWGKMAFQFKSFSIASTQRMMLSGLQQRDMAALNGLWLSVALGMVAYYAKQSEAGRPTSDDPRRWLAEGIDRSGVTGWFFEANNMTEKLTRGHVGLSALLGGPTMSRFQQRNAVGAVIGPTFGTISSIVSVAGNTAEAIFEDDESFDANDIKAVRRLLPYQNLIGFRRLIDAAEQGIIESGK